MKTEKQILLEAKQIGRLVKRGKKHLERILKSAESRHQKGNYRAEVVASLLLQDTHLRRTAQESVKPRLTRLGTLQISALFAASSLLERIARRNRQKLVVQSVDGCSEKQSVYNLTVEDAHLYYANGVLCSNTEQEDHDYDALRYRATAKTRKPLNERIRMSR